MQFASTRLALILCYASGSTACLSVEPDARDAQSLPTENGATPTQINFIPELEEAQRQSAVSKKPVLLIFGAVWCASCRAFQSNTLPTPTVLEISDEFEWVFVNIDRNVSLAREFGVSSTPQMFVLSPTGKRLSQAIGDLGPRKFRGFMDNALDLAELARDSASSTDSTDQWIAEDHTELTWTPDGYRGISICYSHVGYGPFDVPSQSLISFLRLPLRPRTPSTLGHGQTEVRWNETLTNFWALKTGQYRLDYGALTSTLAVAHGLSDTVQLEFEFADFRRFDSVLDGITNTFHDLLGLDDSGREDFPSGENVVQFGAVDSRDESTYSDDVAVTLQHNLTCGTENLPALSYALTARSNVSNNLEGQNGRSLSLGLSTSASRRIGEEYYLYGSLGYVWHDDDEVNTLELNQTQISLLAAGEWRYGPRCSWILQYLYTEAVASETAPFDDPTHEFNIGWKTELENNYVVEISLIENAIVVDNSPDFGIHLGLSKRF